MIRWHVGMAAVVVGLLAAGGVTAAAADTESERAPDDHSAHHHVVTPGAGRYTRSEVTCRVPDVTLLDSNGGKVALRSLLTAPAPVALSFMFTSCTTICPVMTATFAQMRRELGPEGEGLHRVSISIDPEYDTPRVLRTYAEKFAATPDWRFLTGTAADIAQVRRAFDAYTGSKVNHRPLVFFKGAGPETWVRIDGLASGAELADEYRRLRGQ